MGNCVSCADSSSNEQAELRITEGDRKLPDLQASTTGLMMKSDGYNGSGLENMSNGSRTPGSSAHHVIGVIDGNGGAGGNSISGGSQKAEKKTFYSRIPPLGRSGSADKKSSSSSTNASIRDNNNAYSETKISAVFEHYKDPYEECILAEGIERFCKDLEVKPEDFKVLALAWKFGAEQMCRFTREEFSRGMRELKTDSMKGIQARLPDVVVEVLNDAAKFKDLYRFAFKFGLDYEIGQRILPVEMAVSLWRVVFSQKEPQVLERWIQFLETHPHIRGIPRDTWNMFLNFVETVGTDLSSYDDTEAWPSLFDDFVEFENDKLNQNICVISSSSLDKQDQQQVIENSSPCPPPSSASSIHQQQRTPPLSANNHKSISASSNHSHKSFNPSNNDHVN